jgi:hypothetical protein
MISQFVISVHGVWPWQDGPAIVEHDGQDGWCSDPSAAASGPSRLLASWCERSELDVCDGSSLGEQRVRGRTGTAALPNRHLCQPSQPLGLVDPVESSQSSE